ncbi:putative chitinase [Stella humosa]|uniref:Putative chitinase n=1 Tax=Stella humosa TaxID=94 RepID=A0A3N1KWW3_9PROT|nr:peptidoglycan-binding protein [Stella humosa]ROP83962.1 putative chitinase [Stella humosa]BBK33470.1 hypothetical protein STHU_41040 [Stella humosa]
MSRIAEMFRTVAPNAQPAYRTAFEQGGELFARFEVTTPLRIAHFLAQVLHESGGGTVLFENLRYTTPGRLAAIFGVGNHSAAIRGDEMAGLLGNPEALAERVYGLGNPRKARELGNAAAGDGFRYRGGGLLQTTGRGAYLRMGSRCGIDFVADPARIVAAPHALMPALQEWQDGNLNLAADLDDIQRITRRINGGFNGLEDRRNWFARVWPLANDGAAQVEAWEVAGESSDTAWLQQALNDLGARPRLVEDGKSGPATAAAVRWFQGLAGLSVDGVAGPVTQSAIRLRLDAIRGT